jgi:hypothetical protein
VLYSLDIFFSLWEYVRTYMHALDTHLGLVANRLVTNIPIPEQSNWMKEFVKTDYRRFSISMS